MKHYKKIRKYLPEILLTILIFLSWIDKVPHSIEEFAWSYAIIAGATALTTFNVKNIIEAILVIAVALFIIEQHPFHIYLFALVFMWGIKLVEESNKKEKRRKNENNIQARYDNFKRW